MARYIALTARPKASAAPAAGKLELTRAPAQVTRRQKASTWPYGQIQQEVQEVVEGVLDASVALDVPFMQVRLTASWSGESEVERVMTEGYHVSCKGTLAPFLFGSPLICLCCTSFGMTSMASPLGE